MLKLRCDRNFYRSNIDRPTPNSREKHMTKIAKRRTTMKLGAQFYSIRNLTQTPEDIRNSFKKIKEIGYDVAQMSGIGPIDPHMLKDISDEFSLPITCTHSSYDRIVSDTVALIQEHKIYGCPVIGLGGMPPKYRGSVDGVQAFIKEIAEPMKKIKAEGMEFAYHNHAFEFDRLSDGSRIFDILSEDCEELSFILDIYWLHYAGEDHLKYISVYGGSRMSNVHFKDMKSEPQGAICPCGTGTIDMKAAYDACVAAGVKYAQVEQDNAPDSGDAIGEMKTSYVNLAPIFGK